jgi:hypothetical protein
MQRQAAAVLYFVLGTNIVAADQLCSSFNLATCIKRCDDVLGLTTLMNIYCIASCRDNKYECVGGRQTVDNPYLNGLRTPPVSAEPIPKPTAPSFPTAIDRPVVAVPQLTDGVRSAFQSVDNKDIDGQDFQTLKNVDLQSCISVCSVEPRCQGYSFDKWNRYCFLKSNMKLLRLDPRSTSGIRPGLSVPPPASDAVQIERHRGKTFPGTGYRTFKMSELGCVSACRQESNCVAYTYQTDERHCHLFSSADEYFSATLSNSGLKTQSK